MFKKVLIAEDFQDTNQGIVETLRTQFNIPVVQEELYCDKAYNRLKVAQSQNEPFELLITDLLFKKDHVDRRLTSGLVDKPGKVTHLRRMKLTMANGLPRFDLSVG